MTDSAPGSAKVTLASGELAGAVFVFGSNLEGRHGAGAALHAVKNHGAIYGRGVGAQGQAYAIPTKRTPYLTLPLTEIRAHVDSFLQHARHHTEQRFLLTKIGCGLAGHPERAIAPLFRDAPPHVMMIDDSGRVTGAACNWHRRVKLPAAQAAPSVPKAPARALERGR